MHKVPADYKKKIIYSYSEYDFYTDQYAQINACRTCRSALKASGSPVICVYKNGNDTGCTRGSGIARRKFIEIK